MIALNIKTNYYLQSSLIDIETLAKNAKLLNYKALAICDNNMYGVIKFCKILKKYDIKPIIGLEIKYKDIKINLYAKNYKGYQNLIKIASHKTIEKLNYDFLEKYKENLIAIIESQNKNSYIEINKIYKETYISFNSKKTLDDAKKITNALVFSNEVLYINEKEKEFLQYMYLLRDNKQIEERNNYLFHSKNHLLNKTEIIENEYSKNLEYIKENCTVEFKKEMNLPSFFKNEKDTKEFLQNLCIKGLKKRLNNNVSERYKKRLIKELTVINNMNFNNYFLVVWDYVKFAKKNDILVGPGRGSAVGSLVSYCLGITDIDPLKYNLFFERFLNKDRVTMPDIDIDFDSEKREDVINYVINKYGKEKVSGIITFSKFGSKQALKEISKLCKKDQLKTDKLIKLLDNKYSLKENYIKNDEIKNFLEKELEFKKIYKISSYIEKNPKHKSEHAAGIIISNKNIDEIIPVKIEKDKINVSQFTMEYLEEFGLIKMDFLGIETLSLISKIKKDIKNNIDSQFNLNNINYNDIKVFELFNKSQTTGIFQFESEGIKNVLKEFKINSFDDIVALIALYRPGPIKNIEKYIKRKNKLEKIDYYDESLKDILKPTYGIIIYQEQIMQIANKMAGYTLGEADILRRAMSKKKKNVLLKEKEKFIKQSIEKGYKKEQSEMIYNLILKFANYGFNKSHAVAYSKIAYEMAYLKTHYNFIFMKNLLSLKKSNKIKIKEFINECRENNIEILKPSINKSTNEFTIENKKIRYPLSLIKNINTSITNQIIENRKNDKYLDFIDFVIKNNNLNKTILESLILAGTFDDFKINKKSLINSLEIVLNYVEIIKDLDVTLIEKPEIKKINDYSEKEKLIYEKDLYGFYLYNNPVTKYKKKDQNTKDLKNIEDYFDKNITTIIIVNKIKEIFTKKGDKMAFIEGEDELGKASFTIFPKVYKNLEEINEKDILKIKGKVEKRFSKIQIIANEITIINN